MKKILKKENSTKKNKFYSYFKWSILVVCSVIIIYFIISIIFSFKNVDSVQTLDVNLKIGDYVGFNLDQESLNFGTIPPGSGSFRAITLKSDKPLEVHVSFEGDTAKWMNVSKNDFILDGVEDLSFNIQVPNDVVLGDYTGKTVILFTRL